MFPLKDDVPSRKSPVMTITLIIACTLVFIYQTLMSDNAFVEFIYRFGFIPSKGASFIDFSGNVFSNGLYTAVTSIFLHGSWFHLLSNMWFLWIFGDNVEDRMGSLGFLVFYLICGILANLAHMAFNLDSVIPAVGASGAIAGVIGAYYKMYPNAKIRTFIPVFIIIPLIISVPASFFIIIWLITQVYSGAVHSLAGGGSVEGVAWWAHVGGFIGGFLIHRLFAKKQERPRYFTDYE